MPSARTDSDAPLQRPMRADARRNYDRLLAAAHEAFAEDGAAATMDDIARRAGVGPGTLYRHFPTRQHLLEAVYTGEVQEMCRSASDLAELPPWEALVGWLRRYLSFAATKKALRGELITYVTGDAVVFRDSREALIGAGDAVFERAQAAGVLRDDTTFAEVAPLIGAIAGTSDPDGLDRMFTIVVDGLRPPPPAAE